MDKQSKNADYTATSQAASFDTACSVLKMKDSQGENTVYIIFINISSFYTYHTLVSLCTAE